MDTGNVIINVNELKAICFDLLAKGLSLEDGGKIRVDGALDYYLTGMRKVFDLIEDLGKYTEEQ